MDPRSLRPCNNNALLTLPLQNARSWSLFNRDTIAGRASSIDFSLLGPNQGGPVGPRFLRPCKNNAPLMLLLHTARSWKSLQHRWQLLKLAASLPHYSLEKFVLTSNNILQFPAFRGRSLTTLTKFSPLLTTYQLSLVDIGKGILYKGNSAYC